MDPKKPDPETPDDETDEIETGATIEDLGES
jgi:hypothetical protein